MVTVLMTAMTVVVPASLIFVSRRRKEVLSAAYMSGRVAGPGLSFKGSKGATKRVETRSYYLVEIFGEEAILRIGIALGILLVLISIGTVFI